MEKGKKGRIGILTGGGDIPGSTRRSAASRCAPCSEGFDVVGIRRGWAGLVELRREDGADNSEWVAAAHRATLVERYAYSGGTFLHSSRTRPSAVPAKDVPAHLKDKYTAEKNDLTDEVLANLEFLGVDYLVPAGGDDTLSYGVELGRRGFPVVAIPKTMDNDVPGTDYCMGFGTCVNRTIAAGPPGHQLGRLARAHRRARGLRSLRGLHGAAADVRRRRQRCLIPEYEFDIEQLTELLVADRNAHPDGFSVCLVSEGAMPAGGEMVFMGGEKDQYGHAKLGGIGQRVSAGIKELAPQFNGGRKIDMISMNLGYLVRSGAPDAVDCIVPTAYGNLAVDLILRGETGRMVALTRRQVRLGAHRRGRRHQEGRRRRALLRHRAVPPQVRRPRGAADDGPRRRRLMPGARAGRRLPT